MSYLLSTFLPIMVWCHESDVSHSCVSDLASFFLRHYSHILSAICASTMALSFPRVLIYHACTPISHRLAGGSHACMHNHYHCLCMWLTVGREKKRLRDNYKFGSFEFACRLAARLGAGVGETNFIFWINFWYGKTYENHQSTVVVTCVSFKFLGPSVTGRTKHMTTNTNPCKCATNPTISRLICNI
jgi:hypothetical protein